MNPKQQLEALKRHPHRLSEYLAPTDEEVLTVLLEDWTALLPNLDNLSPEYQAILLSEEEKSLTEEIKKDTLPFLSIESTLWEFYRQFRFKQKLINLQYQLSEKFTLWAVNQTNYETISTCIEKEPLALSCAYLIERNYRLCRLATRYSDEAKWFSPYHALEQVEKISF